MSHSSFAVFSLSWASNGVIVMCVGGVSLTLSYLEFAECFGCVDECFIIKSGMFSAIIYFQIFFLQPPPSPYGTSTMRMSGYLMVNHRLLSQKFVYLHSFSFCSSDWIISTDLSSCSQILSSASSNLLLSPSNEYICLNYYTSQFHNFLSGSFQ